MIAPVNGKIYTVPVMTNLTLTFNDILLTFDFRKIENLGFIEGEIFSQKVILRNSLFGMKKFRVKII